MSKLFYTWLSLLTVAYIVLALKPSPSEKLGAVIPTTFSAGTITATVVANAAEMTVTGGVGGGAIGASCTAGIQCSTGICANLACVGPCSYPADSGSEAGGGSDAGAGTFAFVQQVAIGTTSSNTIVATLGTAVGPGDLVSMGFYWDGSGNTVSSVRDDKSNSYALASGTLLTGATTFGPTSGAIYWATPSTSGATVFTVTFATGFSNASLIVGDWSTTSAATFDHGAAATGTGSPSSGSFTTTAGGDLLVGFGAGFYNSAGSGYAERYLGNPPPGIMEDQTAGVAGSYAATAVIDFSSWIMLGASFK